MHLSSQISILHLNLYICIQVGQSPQVSIYGNSSRCADLYQTKKKIIK